MYNYYIVIHYYYFLMTSAIDLLMTIHLWLHFANFMICHLQGNRISFNRFRCIQKLLSNVFVFLFFCIETLKFQWDLFSCYIFFIWINKNRSIR